MKEEDIKGLLLQISGRSDFHDLALNAAEVCYEKNKAYGDSYANTAAMLRLLYPNGISVEHYERLGFHIRSWDKFNRQANDPYYLNEDADLDCLGYALLNARRMTVLSEEKEDEFLGKEATKRIKESMRWVVKKNGHYLTPKGKWSCEEAARKYKKKSKAKEVAIPLGAEVEKIMVGCIPFRDTEMADVLEEVKK